MELFNTQYIVIERRIKELSCKQYTKGEEYENVIKQSNTEHYKEIERTL